MKKLGLINFQHSNDNYGAVIQAAALTYILKKHGFDGSEHIDFIPKSTPPPPLPFLKRIIRLFSKNPFKLIKAKLTIKNDIIGNAQTFETFRKNHINRTKKVYSNLHELSEIKNAYSAVIVGSDQVWRLVYTDEFASTYFLSFVSKDTKRISYAASFGLDYWEESKTSELTLNIKKELQKFDAISVREKSGVNICHDVFDVEATHVLDPTLLVDYSFYENILSNLSSQDNEKIVYYKLDLNEEFLEFVSSIASKLKCDAQNIYYHEEMNKKNFTDVPEWLSKIKNSQLVVTDSFHCVCFSIIFKKQFICIANKRRGIERLQSLLGELGLTDRICFDYSAETIHSFTTKTIDYTEIDCKINRLRTLSSEFLLNSLKGI